MRILAADDDPVILDLLKSPMWLGSDHDLVCVTSADAALQAIRDNRPFDAFLIDVVMPGMDGIALCAAIRAMARHAATPIIMITASTAVDLMQRAFAAGATDFVRKPLDGLELGARINMATLLNASLNRERTARATLAHLRQRTVLGQHDSPFMDVPTAAVSYLSLKNHILGISSGCHAMSLFSLRVSGIELPCDAMAEDDLLQCLAAIGTIVMQEAEQPSTVLAYVGRGLFVGVTFGRRRERLDVLQHRAQIALDRLWDDKGRSDPAPRLLVQALSSLGVWTGATAVKAIEAAVTSQPDPRFARPEDLLSRFVGV